MTGKDIVRLQDIISDDGFYYTFVHYSDFEDIEDAEFHARRERFVKASAALAEYLGVDA
jgi:quinol monooxygenase YgiN